MNPDGKDEFEHLQRRFGGPLLLRTFDQLIDEHILFGTKKLRTELRPKFEEFDLVLTKDGKTGFVEETFYDEDCPDLIVRFSNSDMYLQRDLTLLCSAA